MIEFYATFIRKKSHGLIRDCSQSQEMVNLDVYIIYYGMLLRNN